MLSSDYVAAFFDGEGSVGLTIFERQRSTGWNVAPCITISNKDHRVIKLIGDYLVARDIMFSVRKFNNCFSIEIRSWKSVENFVRNILVHSIVKNESLEVLLDVIEFRLEAKKKSYSYLKDNISFFLEARKKLRSLTAHKGVMNQYTKEELQSRWAKNVRNRVNKKFSDETLMKLWNEGLGDRGMARRLNVHHKTIRARRKKLGLPNNITKQV